ncbi:RING/U-box superfamily protein [Striga asiatica]|uniref:RING-type E3 ubiquitin transferase n=1 Tax=Striga asiatica TaxID=4170 RepID=A0A5A7P6D4_STRAF|nr:RING/U-box superfamily protein [Striga asiatica]
MADSPERFGDTGIIELTGKIMVVAIVLLLFIVLFVFFLHLYAKHFWYRRHENPSSAAPDPLHRRRRRRASGHQDLAVPRRGLDPSVLKTLPIITFDPKSFENGLECAICLSEISLGEKTRFLPKCSHGFHLECIGMWFESHSTCPLCRKPVDDNNPNRLESSLDPPLDSVTIQIPPLENLNNSFPTEAPNFPTNVLIWGDETRVTTFGSSSVEENNRNNIVVEQSLVGSTSGSHDVISTVEIARGLNEDDEQKPSNSMPTGLRSIKRLLSYSNNNRKVNPSSSRDSDFSS